MMPPGHVAATWGVATLLQQNNRRLAHLDFRLLALSGMAPDLIDKPLALFVFTEAQTSQLIGHSFLPNLMLLVCALLFWHKAVPYLLATSGHLLADRMWNHTESFWWPLYGWNVFWDFKPMNTPETMFKVYIDIITRYPQVWVIEILALILFLWYGYHYHLYRRSHLKYFLLTGKFSPKAGNRLEGPRLETSIKRSVPATPPQTSKSP